jgi:imidazolonepropionase-like amidohydrolase
MGKYILLAVSIYTLIGCSNPDKYDLVIRNVGFFDGHQDMGVLHIAINDDTIAAISKADLIGDSVINGTDKYLIPGLVNAHVHASKIEHLQAGYPLGILAILNMHTGLEDREIEWKRIARDSVGFSTLYGSGHAATVPGGHPTQFSPGMETINDSLSIKEWVDHRIEKDVDYIKIIREHHEWMGYPALPTLPYKQIKQLTAYAQSKGYKVIVHATTIEEMVRIAAFKPDGFAHMPDYKEDYPVPESFYNALAESKAFMVTTGGISLKSMDGAPPFIRQWIMTNLLDAVQRAEIIGKLHEHGVLLVAGTDAQEGQMNFSDDYYLELELYKMAGLSNKEILATATGNAAKAFNLPIGELHVGSKADMVLLAGSPLDDIDNLKRVEQVWKNGKTK